MSTIVENINPISVEIEPKNSVLTQTGAIVEIQEPEYAVHAQRKEYKVVGDNIYIPRLYDDAPQWMKDLIGTVVDIKTAVAVGNLDDALEALRTLATELEVAKNTYTMSIVSSNDIDQRINTAIETLNSSLLDADATILNIAQTATTPEEASAIAINTLSASLSASGEIGAFISNMNTAFADLDSATTESINLMESAITAEFNANATAVQTIRTYVGIDEAGASTGTGVSAYLEGSNGVIGSADSNVANNVYVDNNGNSRSKFEYNSSLNIGGTSYNSGFGLSNSAGTGVGSEFWINADKFKFTNNGKTGSAAPFTIDASGSQPQITFNGKVTFGSGQVGTIDQAIAAVVETVAVGDKNINITDNLIPTTSLVADTDNSGYQFIGIPTKSMSAGLESFSEAQIIIDTGDEVYSPYVDEVTIPYYYRFGIKGITNLDIFKIVTIDANNVVSYNDIIATMEVSQTLSAGNWYTIDGVINPTGGTTAADGDIRDINGVKVGSINNFVMPSGTTKVLLGWIADCTISRMKMCKITADTITSDFSSVNGQLVNLQSQIDNVDVSWNSLSGKDVFAQKLGYATYATLESAATAGETVVVGGKINTELIEVNAINANQINTTGLIAENISADTIAGKTIAGGRMYGTYIEGAIIKASFIDLSSTATLTNWQQYTPATYPSSYDANFAKNNNGTLLVDSQGYVRLMGNTKLRSNSLYYNVTKDYGTYSYSNWVMDLYSYDNYKVYTISRPIVSNPTLSMVGIATGASTQIIYVNAGTTYNNNVSISGNIQIFNKTYIFSGSASVGSSIGSVSGSITMNGVTKSIDAYGTTNILDSTSARGMPISVSLGSAGQTANIGFTVSITTNQFTLSGFTSTDFVKINSLNCYSSGVHGEHPSNGEIFMKINIPEIEVI